MGAIGDIAELRGVEERGRRQLIGLNVSVPAFIYVVFCRCLKAYPEVTESNRLKSCSVGMFLLNPAECFEVLRAGVS